MAATIVVNDAHLIMFSVCWIFCFANLLMVW